jgi:hypothetical protein
MAAFCETLADTGLVVDACLAAGKSTVGAYALRRRNPLFAAAWEAALTVARERLADTLLARSIEGTVEQYYKDGELVGERKVIDNRLGLAILRRLDRMVENQFPEGRRRVQSGISTPCPRRDVPLDWDLALSALRGGEPGAMAEALAMFESRKGHELNELNDPSNSPGQDEEPEGIDLSGRCWKQDEMGDMLWMTDFPPPPGFDGYEKGEWGDLEYRRECTPEETELLKANEATSAAEDLEEEEALRDAWFEMLRGELDATRYSSVSGDPPPSSERGPVQSSGV